MTVREPIFRVIIPIWVRVLAFLRVPFARKRVAGALFVEWQIRKKQEEIIQRAQDTLMDVLLYGSTTRFPEGMPCSGCGVAAIPRVMRDDGKAYCRGCDEKRPRFYGKGVAEMLGIKKES